MAQLIRSWHTLPLVFVLALTTGYALPRSEGKGGDMLDAVAAVQRRSPYFLVSEPRPPANWVRFGALYLCRMPRAALKLEALGRYPQMLESTWDGVVCFRGTSDPREIVPWAGAGGDHCLDYGDFAVFGDRDMVREIRAILAAEGFQLIREP
jgi:hypothetical protein